MTGQAALGILTLATAFAFAETACEAAPPTVKEALTIRPHFQKDADIDRPDADTAARCTIDMEQFEGAATWVVRDPGGLILRAFPDTNDDRVVDRWIFFKGGVEVHRDIDSDFDTKADRSSTSARTNAADRRPVSRSQTRRPSVRR